MKRPCDFCKKYYVFKRKTSKVCSNECRWRLYKKQHLARELERHRQWYWDQKATNYERVREINRKAQAKKRFGVTDRQEVVTRDGSKCQNCGSEEGLVIHHIDHQGRGKKKPNNNPSNLVTLCRGCHVTHHVHGRKLKV